MNAVRYVLLIILALPSLGWSLGRVRFGAEFTFYNPEVGPMEIEDFTKRIVPGGDRVVARMRRHLIENQPEGAKFTESRPKTNLRQSKGRFNSPNGWWFEWGYDDSVLEIKTIPESPDFYRRFMNDMQDAIFVSAGNEGLWPALFMGGGHVNLGLEAFDGNLLLLRNFIVDTLFNHNELFLGIFNYDTHNAASIFIQTQKTRAVVRKIIEDFDRGEYADDANSRSSFLRDIHVAMNLESDPCFLKWKTGGTRMCYFGMNLSHYDEGDASRIELKGFRPQASMTVWVNQISLIESRLKYLERLKRPLAIAPRIKVLPLDLRKEGANHLLNPPVNPQQALRSFYTYVTESGERWANHREYIWPAWLSGGAVERFENSEWFKSRERKALCESQLIP